MVIWTAGDAIGLVVIALVVICLGGIAIISKVDKIRRKKKSKNK